MQIFKEKINLYESEKTEQPMKKEKDREKEFVLEIGTGDLPILYSAFKNILENQNTHYIGIDIDKEHLEKAKKEIEKSFGEEYKEKISFLFAKEENLPFKDESIDKIVLQNIFSDPVLGIEDPRMATIACFSDGIQAHIKEIKTKILEETTRVLKLNGVLIIINFYSPEVSQEFFNEEKIKKYLKENFKTDISSDTTNKYKELFLFDFIKERREKKVDFFVFQKS